LFAALIGHERDRSFVPSMKAARDRERASIEEDRAPRTYTRARDGAVPQQEIGAPTARHRVTQTSRAKNLIGSW